MSKIGSTKSGFSPIGGLGLNDTVLNLDNRLSTDFDGVNDYVQIANSASINPDSLSFSISIWFNSTSPNFGYLVNKLAGQGYYIVRVSTVLGCVFVGTGGTVNTFFNTNKTTDGKWHNVIWCLELGASVKMFLDGVLVGQESALGIGSINSATPLNLASNTGGSGTYPKALLDEIIIWKGSALSNADAIKIYNNGLASDPLNPNSYYLNGATKAGNVSMYLKMGDGDAFPTISDNSGNGNNGTMFNMDAGDFVNNVPK